MNDEDYEDEDEDDEGFGGAAKKVEEVEEDPLEGEKHISQLSVTNYNWIFTILYKYFRHLNGA